MGWINWLVLIVTLAVIVLYGIWKSRNMRNISGYLLADRQLPWYHVGLSVMATQASAITFLSAPGQAFSDGMRFIQFYFGLPLAMIVLCVTFVPIFHRLNVYTAYEYLEKRFDLKTRSLTAFLFLLQRGISTGITIYAPSIVLSTLLNIDITYTTIAISAVVIFYTVYGGTKAVSYTQLLQMIIIFSGLIMAGVMVVKLLPANVGFGDALHIAGKMGKANAINFELDLNDRYNVWSGIIGGFFLQLSYFGTDQSQVGRYLTGRSIRQSRLGLVMNGLVKIPMQFGILLIGILVFAFYQFHTPPLFFNKTEVNAIRASSYQQQYAKLEQAFELAHTAKQKKVEALVVANQNKDIAEVQVLKEQLCLADAQTNEIKKQATVLMRLNNAQADTNDTNYVFLSFVMQYLPVGLVGLLIAIIFLAAMGSTAGGLNSLASTTYIDFVKRFSAKPATEKQEVFYSRSATVIWGLFCLAVALFAGEVGNLIEAVNILGSLFYGTILGIFVAAFYFKRLSGTEVFWAAIFTEIAIIIAWKLELAAFLWLNLAGCALVILLAFLIGLLRKQKHPVAD